MAYRSPLYDIPSDLARTVRGVLTFHGRATRTEAWTFMVIGSLLAGLVLSAIATLTGEAQGFSTAQSVTASIASILYFIPVPALFARRLHDIGWSGWFAVAVPAFYGFATVTEGAGPAIAGIVKNDFGWPGTIIVLTGVALMYLVLLLPTSERADRFGANPRLVNEQP
ncbi:DUF805 domain-containing protein [Parerythrobacter lacustris]|uniref:DUF805 domain-containing protein n=1 Tax=Parerythrobacter lacustris TaxID=2969984 RepID=A0ABT1XSB2_9SPHN|nr:DUF805 domain-containing protein [Parerythrobacter lacustris]MCR2834533.1 DUF805 domain-containing protein [Parerythrobacter lacustris]